MYGVPVGIFINLRSLLRDVPSDSIIVIIFYVILNMCSTFIRVYNGCLFKFVPLVQDVVVKILSIYI